MKKIIYYFGIYTLCVDIHIGLRVIIDKIKEFEEEKGDRQNKGAIGIQPVPAKKPMNKIGFQIPQD